MATEDEAEIKKGTEGSVFSGGDRPTWWFILLLVRGGDCAERRSSLAGMGGPAAGTLRTMSPA